MICKNCSTLNNDNAVFCQNCGTPLEASASQENIQTQESISAEAPVAATADEIYTPQACESPVAACTPQSQECFGDAPDQPQAYYNSNIPQSLAEEALPPQLPVQKKKMKPLAKVLIIAGSVLAVLIAVGVIFGSAIKNLIVNNLSPEKHLQYVYSQYAADALGDFSEIYDSVTDTPASGKTTKGSVEVKLPDILAVSFKEALGGADLSSLAVDYELAKDGKGNASVTFDAKLSDNSVISGIACYDAEGKRIIVDLPGLTDKALQYDMSTDESSVVNAVLNAICTNPDYIPSGDAVKSLITDMLTAMLDEIAEVERSSSTFTANGITQNATLLSAKITSNTFEKSFCAALDVLAENKDVEKLIKGIYADYSHIIAGSYDSANEFYAEFIETLADAKKEMSESLDGDESLLMVDTWVDFYNNILAVKYYNEDMEYFSGTAKNGNDIGIEMYQKTFYYGSEDLASSCKGGGTIRDGKFNGELTYSSFDYETNCSVKMYTIKYRDVDVNQQKQGNICGTFTLSLEEGLASLLGDDFDNAIFDPTTAKIIIDVNSTDKSFNADITLNVSSINMLTIKVTQETLNSGKVNIPASTTDNAEEWVASIDTETLMKRLEEAGITQEVLDGFAASFGADDYSDEYYDDDYYYDDNYAYDEFYEYDDYYSEYFGEDYNQNSDSYESLLSFNR